MAENFFLRLTVWLHTEFRRGNHFPPELWRHFSFSFQVCYWEVWCRSKFSSFVGDLFTLLVPLFFPGVVKFRDVPRVGLSSFIMLGIWQVLLVLQFWEIFLRGCFDNFLPSDFSVLFLWNSYCLCVYIYIYNLYINISFWISPGAHDTQYSQQWTLSPNETSSQSYFLCPGRCVFCLSQ